VGFVVAQNSTTPSKARNSRLGRLSQVSQVSCQLLPSSHLSRRIDRMSRCSAAAVSSAPFREREEALLRSLFQPRCFCPPVRVFGSANAGKTRTVLSALRVAGCTLVAFIDCLQLHSERQLVQSIAAQWSGGATQPAAAASSAASAAACSSLADLPALITAMPELHRQTAFVVLKEPQVGSG
jgi:hypothetical protein